MKTHHLVILTGPTASGKTDLSLKLAYELNGEIINADMGQFYTPLSIGTAKPEWQKNPIPHHLFDIIDEPKDLTVVHYRKLLLETAEKIWKKGKTPIIVGGSLFYLKSLVCPPQELEIKEIKNLEKINESLSPWRQLEKIDPLRSSQLHKNDLYRIHRAIEIWKTTGRKPSEVQPSFDPPCDIEWIFLNPDPQTLQQRIEKRTREMILGNSNTQSWISEVENLSNTEWESFLLSKKLIGYPEIIEWIKRGKPQSELENLISDISTKTWQYARRQLIFWKKLDKDLKEFSLNSKYLCSTKTIS